MELAKSYLKPNQELIEVKYFTSYISNDPPKEKKQRTYLDALNTTGIKILKGKYEKKDVECSKCNHSWSRSNEKMTDVNIAISIVMDAIKNKYDVAILISGDSDLIPAIRAVNDDMFPKIVTVIFPPSRENRNVKEAAKGSYILGRKRLKDYQFPEEIVLENGFKLVKPLDWYISI